MHAVMAVAPYAGILVAAIVEGEVAYIGAAALVAEGRLHPVAVCLAGALGAAIGDQAFFYALRGRLPRWVSRYPSLERTAAPLVSRVRRHATLMVLLIRFTPGLRIAITAACTAADVSAWKFSLLSLVSAFAWALAVLVVVGWLGPSYLAPYGLGGWKGALVLGGALVGLLAWFGRYERRPLDR